MEKLVHVTITGRAVLNSGDGTMDEAIEEFHTDLDRVLRRSDLNKVSIEIVPQDDNVVIR